MKRRNGSGSASEFVAYGVVSEPKGIEVLHAKFGKHQFGEHAHDSWAIGAVLAGAKDISAKRGRPHAMGSGDVYVLPPHHAHAGRSLDEAGCEYTMLYIPDTEWQRQRVIHQVSIDAITSPARKHHIGAQLHRIVSLALEQPNSLQAWTSEWDLLCEALFGQRQGPIAADWVSKIPADVAIRRGIDYLKAFFAQDISLEQLSGEVSMSTFELCRRFSAATGLSPHRYQLVLRIHEAKARLLRGETISDVAVDLGFADQSHLGRHFKSLLGVTPGTVARQSRRMCSTQ